MQAGSLDSQSRIQLNMGNLTETATESHFTKVGQVGLLVGSSGDWWDCSLGEKRGGKRVGLHLQTAAAGV